MHVGVIAPAAQYDGKGDTMRSSEDGVFPAGPGGGADVLRMDCTGMRCPQPVLRLAAQTAGTPAGTVVEIVGDCPTFEKDVRVFCERRKKTVLAIWHEGARTTIRVRC